MHNRNDEQEQNGSMASKIDNYRNTLLHKNKDFSVSV